MNRAGCQDGAGIRRLREVQGFTVTQLAKRAGIRPQTLSNIELGNKPAGLETLVNLARELGVTVDELILSESPDQGDTKDPDQPEDESVPNGAAA